MTLPASAASAASAPDDDVRAAQGGDRQAFERLYRTHVGRVFSVCVRMCGNRSEAEERTQDAFVRAWEKLPQFRGESSFATWLHRLTVNVVLMHRRSAKSRPVLAPEAPPEVVADERAARPDEEAERSQRMAAFQRLLARLADKKRVVFVLHELEGLSPTEISEIVAAPVLTVRTRLFYARRELEEMLADEPALAGLDGSFGKGGAGDD